MRQHQIWTYKFKLNDFLLVYVHNNKNNPYLTLSATGLWFPVCQGGGGLSKTFETQLNWFFANILILLVSNDSAIQNLKDNFLKINLNICNPLPCRIHGNGFCKSTFGQEGFREGGFSLCTRLRFRDYSLQKVKICMGGGADTLGMNCTNLHSVHGGRDGDTRNILYTYCTQYTQEEGRTH